MLFSCLQVDDLQTTIEDDLKCSGDESKILTEDLKSMEKSNELEKPSIENSGSATPMQAD